MDRITQPTGRLGRHWVCSDTEIPPAVTGSPHPYPGAEGCSRLGSAAWWSFLFIVLPDPKGTPGEVLLFLYLRWPFLNG